MNEHLFAAVDVLEEILCERYNVKSLTGVGPFTEALAQARVGNLEAIDAAMDGRQMYRWRETAEAALQAIHEAVESLPAPEESDAAPDDEAEKPKRRGRT